MRIDINQFNVMIIESENLLSSSVKNMLKRMGFDSKKIYKAPNLISFKRLIRRYPFQLIICRYSDKSKPIGHKYHRLYEQCSRFSHACTFAFLTQNPSAQDYLQMEELHPDNIIEIPFNYNQFKSTVSDAIKKRQALAVIYSAVEKGQMKQAVADCAKFAHKKPAWHVALFRILVEHYIENKKYQLALKLLQQLQLNHPNEWYLVKLIELNAMLGNNKVLLPLAHEYEALGYPQNHTISEITAYKSILDSDLNTALQTLKQTAERYPHLIDVSINLAYLYIASDDLENAYTHLRQVDHEFIYEDQQFFCIEEVKTSLEIVNKLRQGNRIDLQKLEKNLLRIMYNIEQVDDVIVTKKLHQTILDVTANNPVCPLKRLLDMRNKTRLPHRKLIITLIAYYLGYIDEVGNWVESEQKRLVKKRTMNAAVESILYDKLKELKNIKIMRMQEADNMEKTGRILEPLAIKSQECPSLITNHLKFVNSMIKYKLNVHSDLNLLTPQFNTSILVLMNNLQQQNPKHPKLVKIAAIQKIVLEKIAAVEQEKQSALQQS